jgi:hypothetical protein
MQWVLFACLLVANYYATTFAVWFGHWSSHLRWSPFRSFHVYGHHRLYPDSAHSRTEHFRFGSGRHDSLYSLLPWLLLLLALQWIALPHWQFLGCVSETALVAAGISYVHQNFHLTRTPLVRFAWFQRARAIHETHHDDDVNFMIADHFWDRVAQTYVPPSSSKGL